MSSVPPNGQHSNVRTNLARVANNHRQAPLLFEIAWEVCCQTGGIYTVLRSKAPATVNKWKSNYILLGPFRDPGAKFEFEAAEPSGVLADAIAELRDEGLHWHYGHWLITGRPQVLLCDLGSVFHARNEFKYYYWKDTNIGLPENDAETDGIVALGHATARLLQAMRSRVNDRPILAHFHEWQGGAALPLMKSWGVDVATVFTTHATLVGRSLSAANVELYDHLKQINGEDVAYDHQFAHRFMIERAAAHSADVFTTVSGITAMESEQFLGRSPEVLVPNGLNIERFAAPYEFQMLHRQSKQHIHEFVMGHFFPSYQFDLDKTLYIFTAGRYEPRNKGFDVFIEALHDLNRRLKAQPSGVTVVAFIIAPAPYRSLNVTTLNRQAMFGDIRDTCEAISEEMSQRLMRTVSEGRMPELNDLLDEYARVRLKRMVHAYHSGPPPTIVTHDLENDSSDSILQHLRHRGLCNHVSDPVKVVFHPQFITSTSPVLGLEYDEFVRGCNLGVFPSYYEPWGYTPMECIIRGIPAITSDLSGFGAYVMSHFPEHDKNGIFVARRRGRTFYETVIQVSSWLYELTRMSPRERIDMRYRVEQHAAHFDWENLTQHYGEARAWAIKKRFPDWGVLNADPEVRRDLSSQMSDRLSRVDEPDTYQA